MFPMAQLLHIKKPSLLLNEKQKLAGFSDPSPGPGQQAQSQRGSEHRAEHSQPARVGLALQRSPSPGRDPCPHSYPTRNGSERHIENRITAFSLERGNHHSASQTSKLPGANVCTGTEWSEPLMAFFVLCCAHSSTSLNFSLFC